MIGNKPIWSFGFVEIDGFDKKVVLAKKLFYDVFEFVIKNKMDCFWNFF
jgi:hypothetical protein